MSSSDQSLVTAAFLWKNLSQPQFYKDLTRKTAFFEGWSWFSFNKLGLALGTNLKFYTSVTKGLKLKVRKFWGLIPTFVEVTRETFESNSISFFPNYPLQLTNSWIAPSNHAQPHYELFVSALWLTSSFGEVLKTCRRMH